MYIEMGKDRDDSDHAMTNEENDVLAQLLARRKTWWVF
jgi:hypothetical protein